MLSHASAPSNADQQSHAALAAGAAPAAGASWRGRLLRPLAEYRNDTRAMVHFTQAAAQQCNEIFDLAGVDACARIGVGEVWMPNPCSAYWRGDRYADLMCHEIGHTNGWPATHPERP